MKNTAIEWADHTFNPWIGCTKVSPACDHCYAEKSMPAKFQGITWGAGQPRKRTSAANWAQPLKWDKEAERTGTRPRVFCASLADVFDNAVPNEWRADLFELIEATPNLDWLLLTKRIGNADEMIGAACIETGIDLPKNYWIGATICNQTEADRDIPKLLAVPAAKRFLSIEPLLGPVDLTNVAPPTVDGRLWHGIDVLTTANRELRGCIDWVIVGGESGPQARPMHPDWARSLRDQCVAADVPFFFKQWGEWLPRDEWSFHVPMIKQCAIKLDGSTVSHDDAPQDVGGHRFEFVGKKAAGRLLDGREWNEVPGEALL